VTALAVPALLLGPGRGALVAATTLAVTVAAGFYGNAIIGGVVGDFLGATIQVGRRARQAMGEQGGALEEAAVAGGGEGAVGLGLRMLPCSQFCLACILLDAARAEARGRGRRSY
jgi:hypothetical protein